MTNCAEAAAAEVLDGILLKRHKERALRHAAGTPCFYPHNVQIMTKRDLKQKAKA